MISHGLLSSQKTHTNKILHIIQGYHRQTQGYIPCILIILHNSFVTCTAITCNNTIWLFMQACYSVI